MPAGERLSWFRWNPQDYVSDPAVRAMSYEERGRYVDVLMSLYLTNVGTASEDAVRIWAGYSEPEWPFHREQFARAFRVGRDGKWTQKRVAMEVRAARNRVKRAAESGRAGGRASAGKRQSSLALLQQPFSEPKATP